MDKIETYAEEKFILNLLLNVPNNYNIEVYKIWFKVYELLKNKCTLHIDSIKELSLLAGIDPITGEINQASANPLALSLMKATTSGGSQIKDGKKHLDEIHSDKLNFLKTETPSPIYCLSSPIKNINCGVFIADSDNYLEKFRELVRDTEATSTNVKQNNSFSWESVINTKPKLNSIIIADPFVLQNQNFDETEKVYPSLEKSLIPILDTLLPEKDLDETIHITIIIKRIKIRDKTQDNELKAILTSAYEATRKYIEKHIETKISDFKLGIYVTKKDSGFHDRMVISNYFFLVSGRGFDLYNSNDKFLNTIFTHYPIGFSNNINAFHTELEKLANLAKDCKNNPPYIPDIFGDKENRLLNITE
jgi:hypothetical protein